MIALNATQVRNEWSTVVDSVIRDKPKFIKRTRDRLLLSEVTLIEEMLSAYKFSAIKYIEDDGSVTLSLTDLDLAENGTDENDAIKKLSKAIIEYSEDYYNEFALWFSAPNRKAHLPYVIKALIINDVNKIGELITCHPVKSTPGHDGLF